MSLPNNCDIFILSHNSKQYTKSVYDSLIQQHQNVFVLENSYIESEKFQNENTIDFGSENIGVGGFLDFLITKYSDKDDFFVGIFNNDITNISEDLYKNASKFFTPDVGIISPSLNDPGCPYPEMFKIGDDFRKVQFVENVAVFVNSRILRELKDSIPVHYWGWVDVICSKISNYLKLDNIILDNSSITHERSGVRKKMEDVDKNYSTYMSKADQDYNLWIEKNSYLNKFI